MSDNDRPAAIHIPDGALRVVSKDILPATDEALDRFIAKKKAFDPRTGLNAFEDERLIRAHEAMIVAVQVFNSPTVLFKTEVFVILANIAWTYLLREYYLRRIGKITEEDGKTASLYGSRPRSRCDSLYSS